MGKLTKILNQTVNSFVDFNMSKQSLTEENTQDSYQNNSQEGQIIQYVVTDAEQTIQLLELEMGIDRTQFLCQQAEYEIVNEQQQLLTLTIIEKYAEQVKNLLFYKIKTQFSCDSENTPKQKDDLELSSISDDLLESFNIKQFCNNSNQEIQSIHFDSHQEQSYSVLMDDPHSKEKSSNTLEVQQQLETVVSQELSHQQQVQSILKLIKEQEQLQQECTQKSPKIHINQKEQEKMYKQLIKFNKQVQKQIAKMQKQQQKLLNNIEMLKQQEMMMVDLYRMQFANNSMLTHITYNIVINMQNMPDNSYLLLSDCFNELMKNIQIKQLTTKDLCIVCNDSDLDQVKQYLNLVELNEKKLTYRIDIEHYEGKQKDIEQQLNYVVIVNMKGLPKYYSSIFYEHFQEIIQCNSIKILRNNNIEIVCQKQQLENVKNAVSIKVDNQILQFTYKMK
ncbi:Hypothetical_protein [Hexamita inflata]|uniref:Hypothetical_protein n=1 Tax=Hexamita inflata TaxID=28002 RepID=A0AA86RF68_9EUKA|nr:Hypothetical protein HINF_LOCUS32008 [Hexamita inflata]CAI9973011.1 Hypothetical protein HINF_LOCUS60656 [Hexamita inflata]